MATKKNLFTRLFHLLLAVFTGILATVAISLLFSQTPQNAYAAPLERPLIEIITGSLSITHTENTTHQMRVYGNGRITDQFFTDNSNNTNQVGINISATTIAVLFDQHPADTVDVGSQGNFQISAPITLNTVSTYPGYSEDTRAIYASSVLSYQITQQTFATTTNNCVIMDLTVENSGSISLTNGILLYMMDLDVALLPTGDIGFYDADRQVVYITDYNPDFGGYGYSMGISLLTGSLRGYGILSDDNINFPNMSSDPEIKTEILTPTNAIANGNNNILWLVANVADLAPAQSDHLRFAICANAVPGDPPSAEDEAGDELLDDIDNLFFALTVVKTATPASGSTLIAGSTPVTYTITIVNSGNRIAENITFTDTIPALTNLISYTATQGSIGVQDNTITATLGNLSPGVSAQVTIVVMPSTTLAHNATITNLAYISSSRVAAISNQVSHQIFNPPILNITKTVSPQTNVLPGSRLTYTIIVSNTGQGLATNAVISDTLPANTAFVSDSIRLTPTDAGTPGSEPPTLATGLTITPGQSITVTFAVTVNSNALPNLAIVNTATVTSSQVATPTTATVTATVIAQTDLRITKTVSPVNVLPGQPLTYTLAYTNNGPATAAGPIITDSIPAILTDVSFTFSGPPITPSGSYVWQIANLSPGQGGIITITGIVSPDIVTDTLFANTAQIGADVSNMETVPGNNTSTVTASVTLPRVAFSTNAYSVLEANGPAVITVTLSATPYTTTTVNYTTGGITATPGQDYTVTTGQLTFEPDVSILTFTIPITDDTIDENNELVLLTLSNPNRAVLGAPSEAELTIIDDDDPPVADFSSAAYTVNESAGSAVITVSLSSASAFAISVDYETTTGSATADQDFTPVSGTLDFPPLTTVQTFTIPILPDSIDEPDETIGLSLTGATNATVGVTNNPAILTILDDDDPPSVDFQNAPYTAGESAGSAVIPVVLSSMSAKLITVTYTITDGTATIADNDYGGFGGLLIFTPGITRQTFSVTINNDNQDETDETILLSLDSAVNATGTPTSTTLTIIDDDEAILAVNKQAPALVSPGQRLTYTIIVENSGNAPATGVTITDPVPTHTTFAGTLSLDPPGAGTVLSPPTLVNNLTISAGQQITVTYAVTVSKPLTDGTVLVNTVSVTSNQTATPITDTATTTVEATPAIQVVKSGPASAAINSTLTFTFTVTNSGDSLVQVTDVVDNLAAPVTFAGGDNGDGWLDLTESWIYSAPYTVPPNAPTLLVNTVSVTAADGLGTQVFASAIHTTSISFNPALTITKSGPVSATVGQTVVFTFEVRHAPTSDGSPVRSLLVSDDFAGLASLVSYGNSDQWLDFGETWVYTAAYTIKPTTPNPFVNTGTVVARDKEDEAIIASTTHSMSLSGFDPSLFVDKDGPTTAGVGNTAQYTFTVVNYADFTTLQLLGFDLLGILANTPGDGSPIAISSITDSVAGLATYSSGDNDNDGKLDAGEAWYFTASHSITADDPDPLVNTVTVIGADQEGDQVSATDSHSTNILYNPAVDISVTTPISAAVGQTFSLTFTVKHNAISDNSPVNSLSLDDGLAGSVAVRISGDTNGNNLLDLLEQWIYTTAYTVRPLDFNPLNRVATVQGKDQENNTITASMPFSIPIDGNDGNWLYLPLLMKNP